MRKGKLLMLLAVFSVMALVLLTAASRLEDATVSTVTRPVTGSGNPFYIGNKAPLQPLNFIKLPVGSIEPAGWIKKYLELQRDGLTGKLGEISAWLEKKNNAWFSDDGKGERGWEEVPYWLKGYGDLGYILHDEKIIAETKSWLEKVFKSQRADGYFGPVTMVKNSKHPEGVMDLWPNMIMLWCLQSYYDYSHDERVIHLMDRYFKWEAAVPDSLFLETYWENSRGGDNLYSIYWLYNRTGEPWLLDLAAKVHRNTADWMQKDNLPNWHNVNIAQSFREPATFFMQAKDSSFLNASYNDFWLIRDLYGQVPGGMFGADEDARPGYTDPRQGVETCGMVEQMSSDEMLERITGDPFWADHCENVAFNTYPAAVMPDFRSLRYITCPNMAISNSDNHSPGIENDGPFLTMNPFSSRCCQHNHAQGWPYYEENLWMATPDKGVVAMLYNSCTVKAQVGDGTSVTLKESTHYPFDDHVAITVNTSNDVKFPLYVRIPQWCHNASLSVNGKRINHTNVPATYTRLERKWKNGDVIDIRLPMEVNIVEWKKNKNSVSVNYGPLTFSLKIKEVYKKEDSKKSATADSRWQPAADASKWPSYEIYPGSDWNYGLILDRQYPSRSIKVVKKAWPRDDFPFSQENVPLELVAQGKQVPEWKIDRYGLVDTLPESPVTTHTTEETITLIPMGAARLRISAFPVVN